MHSDERTIRLVLNGQKSAFRALLDRHHGSVYRLAFRILGSREEAEDAVQETFLRVYQNLRSYTETGRFWPWARRITLNVCFKRLSRSGRDCSLDELPDTGQPVTESVELTVLQKMECEAVRKVIAGLPPPYRIVVILRYQEDLSYKEIAEEMGVPANTVQVRLFRAKKMMAERLKSEVPSEMQ